MRLRRRPQPPVLAVRRRDGEGQPPGRWSTTSRRRSAGRPQLPHTTHLEVEVDRLDQLDEVLASGRSTRSCSTTSPRRPPSRASAGSAAGDRRGLRRHHAGHHRRRRGDRGRRDQRGALTHSVRALDLASGRGRRTRAMIYLDEAATTPLKRDVLEAMWPVPGPSTATRPATTRWARPPPVPRPPAPRRRHAGCPTGGDHLHLRRHRSATTPRSRASRWPGREAGTSSSPRSSTRPCSSQPLLGRPASRSPTLECRRRRARRARRSRRRAARRHDAGQHPVANNEVGTVQPIAELAALAARTSVPFHTDAVQAAGWLDLDVDAARRPGAELSGHKFGAPKGVGVLYVGAARRSSR